MDMLVEGVWRDDEDRFMQDGAFRRERSAASSIRFFTRTSPRFTGRATVPVLWDRAEERLLSNAPPEIIAFFDAFDSDPRLRPPALEAQIDQSLSPIHNGLSNAARRAGPAI